MQKINDIEVYRMLLFPSKKQEKKKKKKRPKVGKELSR